MTQKINQDVVDAKTQNLKTKLKKTNHQTP